MPELSPAGTATANPAPDQVVEPLLALFGLFKEHADACITAAGITMPQAVALLRLDTPLSQRELADCLRYDASNITGIVDGLEHLGLVERQVDPADRRVRRVVVTAAGADVVAHMRECLFRDEPLVGALDAHEVTLLAALLAKAIDGREASGWVELFRPRR